MRRKYDTSLYTDRVNFIKSIKPDCCIGVDVIVGYPGETYHEFQKTYEYLKDLDVSYLHVFTYSERANTTAIKLGEKIPMNVRKKRSQDLQVYQKRKNDYFINNIFNPIKQFCLKILSTTITSLWFYKKLHQSEN